MHALALLYMRSIALWAYAFEFAALHIISVQPTDFLLMWCASVVYSDCGCAAFALPAKERHMASTYRKPLLSDIAEFVSVLRSNVSPAAVAAYVMASDCMPALSHMIEDAADDGTFAAAVFAILCGEA